MSSSYARRLHVETLEDRRLLAITVDTLVDEADGSLVDGDISLRDAIAAAPAGETINFAVAGTINLDDVLGQIEINKSLKISGPGAKLLTIDAGGGLDGEIGNGDGFRIFSIDEANSLQSDVAFSGLTLTGGDVTSGVGGGGAIRGFGKSLVISNSVISHNASTDGGGAISVRLGSTATVSDSTFSDNRGSSGGAISSSGTLNIRNSTLSGNRANSQGGAISFFNNAVANIANSTITNNSAGQLAGGINAISGMVNLASSIVAGNSADPSAPNIRGTLVTDTNNLIDGDPRLGPLADNGGPTPTHALLPGSLALNAGSFTAPSAVHVDELNNSLTDSLGGPDLVDLSGTLTASGYDFAANEGLNLFSANINPAEYTIELNFSFDLLSGYQKILDFKNLTADEGLYSQDSALEFYDGTVGEFRSLDVLTPNTLHHLVLTRDDTTDEVNVRIDGVEVLRFTDTSESAVFSEADQIIRFFQDDNAFSGEAEAGFVDRIRIYDAVLDLNDQRGAPFDRVVGTSADVGAYEAQVAPSADFDGDFDVDGADFLAWQRGFGSEDALRSDGNSDDDADVDASDLAAWALTYGQDSIDATGGSQPHENIQPSLGLNYLIATQGIFPSDDFIPFGEEPFLGEIALFAGNFEPSGWEFADGELLPINQNAALFSILGTTYGGDGETNFALPDLRGRAALGEGFGPGLTPRALGEKTGVETVTLTTAQLPSHSHSLGGMIDTTQVGGGAAHENVQPSLGLNYVITTQGIYPSRDGFGPFHNGYLGAITVFAGSQSDRTPFLDGQLLPIPQNDAVFSLLGTTYGGDGETTFALPDLRGRVPVHADSQTSGQRTGSRFGVETVTLNTNQLPVHEHTLYGSSATTNSTGSGQAHENHQPALALNYAINLTGVFPVEDGSFGTNHIGAIVPFAGNFAPQGSAFLDGQLLNIDQYSALFSVIGTTYGGDGETTFALPDLRGRTPVGFGQGTGLTNRSLGEKFGQASVMLTVDQIPAHQHEISANTLLAEPSAPETSLSATNLIDAALAMAWLEVTATDEADALTDKTVTAETALATSHKTQFSTPVSTASRFAKSEVSEASSKGFTDTDEPWLADELLEQVFG